MVHDGQARALLHGWRCDRWLHARQSASKRDGGRGRNHDTVLLRRCRRSSMHQGARETGGARRAHTTWALLRDTENGGRGRRRRDGEMERWCGGGRDLVGGWRAGARKHAHESTGK